MDSASVELRPTIDRSWLEQVASADPITHAYAVWDLAHAPDRVRFISVGDAGRTEGYLLFWLGHPTAIVVHWVGVSGATEALARALPPRPFVAVVPPAVRESVLAARGPGREYGIRILARERSTRPPREAPPGDVRLLVRADRPAITSWAARQGDRSVAEYRGLDPAADPAWAAFDRGAPVGIVRAAVRLPTVWILGGVYVDPVARRQGWGRRLVAAAASAAEEAGARPVLYVRDDGTAAVRLYEGLGFRTVDRRLWLDLGAGLDP